MSRKNAQRLREAANYRPARRCGNCISFRQCRYAQPSIDGDGGEPYVPPLCTLWGFTAKADHICDDHAYTEDEQIQHQAKAGIGSGEEAAVSGAAEHFHPVVHRAD